MAEKPWNTVCPACKDYRAYQGFQTVECTTCHCKNYSIKQSNLVKEYKIALEEEMALQLPAFDDTVVNMDAEVDGYEEDLSDFI